MFRILVIEDDTELRELYVRVLERGGYNALPAASAAEAESVLEKEKIDLMITDVMLPDKDGYTLTASLRAAKSTLPVLIITAKGLFDDKRAGFDAGADDYMVKPIDINEMLLRVNALLRRAKSVSERKLVVADTVLEYDTLSVVSSQMTTQLPLKEFQLLYKLLSYPGRIYTRQQIMDDIWGYESETDAHTVDVHINRLRERFTDNRDFEIVTVRGLGYKAVRKEQ